MVESFDEPDILDRTRSSPGTAYAPSKPFRAGDQSPDLKAKITHTTYQQNDGASGGSDASTSNPAKKRRILDVPKRTAGPVAPSAPPPPEDGQGEKPASIGSNQPDSKPNIFKRFKDNFTIILFGTWLNVLLVFVPVGIAVDLAGVNKTVVFAMNAIAIIPLAGLLSFATEQLASELGDTIGALMNVTFGNAVELIIFIALTKNEIAIVQASLLGSILANLLLILGMCFLFGGLRFREQVYNSTVTQMSACLLSLSVMSLLLPTAFHASFVDGGLANQKTLEISRGTSVILLLVYVLYLLFQLKSHAYMYQSTPQHVIDEESHPGLLHDVFDTSSSSSDSSSSSSSDSDGSSGSNTTAKRIKRVLKRGRRRRKSSGTSGDTPSALSTHGNPSVQRFGGADSQSIGQQTTTSAVVDDYVSGDEADNDRGRRRGTGGSIRDHTRVHTRDFESEKFVSSAPSRSPEITKKNSRRKHRHQHKRGKPRADIQELSSGNENNVLQEKPRIVDFQEQAQEVPDSNVRRPFNLRVSVRDAFPTIPAMPKIMTNTVFSTTEAAAGPKAVTGITPRALHRSHSLPNRLNQTARQQSYRSQPVATLQPQPYLTPPNAAATVDSNDPKPEEKKISRVAAIILLIGSTALVALCAEFLVSSIDYFVATTDVSEAFVGLIILPIVGNAAEHVCAVTVASKNKMDLAIGVAVGSSIQIALFVTPVIVLLGWMMDKEMTLYFSLFETVSLFVSAFIVNFLVLDGRSNYLEGALLIAAYIIIALAAFFYPDGNEASTISGDRQRGS